jgi:bifunctional DNA-binding transcriptional regulator/antitoxin component of YhaV-PrlF toxin-antitoxin module
MPYGPDKINEIVDTFNALQPGEDIIHGNDIEIKELQGTQRAFEYGKYTDDLLAKIHMALKVPMTMWTEPERARPIFEPYVQYLQSMVEAAINSQLMPQLVSKEGMEPALIKFRQININDAFTKAKTDMIYLSEGVLGPGEVREERGLDPEGVVELTEVKEAVVKAAGQSDKNANISGGKNQDKKEESARAQNRGNKPAANATGDRK